MFLTVSATLNLVVWISMQNKCKTIQFFFFLNISLHVVAHCAAKVHVCCKWWIMLLKYYNLIQFSHINLPVLQKVSAVNTFEYLPVYIKFLLDSAEWQTLVLISSLPNQPGTRGKQAWGQISQGAKWQRAKKAIIYLGSAVFLLIVSVTKTFLHALTCCDALE